MHIIFIYIYLTTLLGTQDYRLLNDYATPTANDVGGKSRSLI